MISLIKLKTALTNGMKDAPLKQAGAAELKNYKEEQKKIIMAADL
jgi:hypothetical protein